MAQSTSAVRAESLGHANRLRFRESTLFPLAYAACRAASSPTPSLPRGRCAEGKLVALPTETVYGLGADSTNATAVARIFAAKERPLFDPLILHLASRDWLPRVVSHVPPAAERLAKKILAGTADARASEADIGVGTRDLGPADGRRARAAP